MKSDLAWLVLKYHPSLCALAAHRPTFPVRTGSAVVGLPSPAGCRTDQPGAPVGTRGAKTLPTPSPVCSPGHDCKRTGGLHPCSPALRPRSCSHICQRSAAVPWTQRGRAQGRQHARPLTSRPSPSRVGLSRPARHGAAAAVGRSAELSLGQCAAGRRGERREGWQGAADIIISNWVTEAGKPTISLTFGTIK